MPSLVEIDSMVQEKKVEKKFTDVQIDRRTTGVQKSSGELKQTKTNDNQTGGGR